MLKPDKTTVFYDGGCPLCRREIDHYRRIDPTGRIRLSLVIIRPQAKATGRTALVGLLTPRGMIRNLTPTGVGAVIAENFLFRQQLQIVARSRQRAGSHKRICQAALPASKHLIPQIAR